MWSLEEKDSQAERLRWGCACCGWGTSEWLVSCLGRRWWRDGWGGGEVSGADPKGSVELGKYIGFYLRASSEGKASACNAGDPGSIPGLGRCPRERNRKSRGQRSLVGYSSWGHKELDTPERLHFTSPCVVGNHWRVLSTGIMDILLVFIGSLWLLGENRPLDHLGGQCKSLAARKRRCLGFK